MRNAAVCLLGLIALSCLSEETQTEDNHEGSSKATLYDMSDFMVATDLAVEALQEQDKYTGEYKLIRVENLYYKDPKLWFATFKPTKFIPDAPPEEPLPLGGEVFVSVNVGTRQTRVTGGE